MTINMNIFDNSFISYISHIIYIPLAFLGFTIVGALQVYTIAVGAISGTFIAIFWILKVYRERAEMAKMMDEFKQTEDLEENKRIANEKMKKMKEWFWNK